MDVDPEPGAAVVQEVHATSPCGARFPRGIAVAPSGRMATIAVPLGDEFEDSEFTVPRDRLVEAGHRVVTLGPQAGTTVRGKRGQTEVRIDAAAKDVDPTRFDVLLIPGGHSPDHLRTDGDVVGFVRRFVDSGKPVAAVCHGPQLLIEADAVRGRTLTSWPSVRKDLENAGARWVDREVVEDGELITSRRPSDLEAFSRAVLSHLAGRAAHASA
jgi:protease I